MTIEKEPKRSLWSVARDPDYAKGVISSIVASLLFLILVQPLAQLFWRFLVATSESGLRVLSDRIYTGAAYGFRDENAYTLLLFFIGLLHAGMLVHMLSSRRERSSLSPEPRKTVEEVVLPNGLKLIFKESVARIGESLMLVTSRPLSTEELERSEREFTELNASLERLRGEIRKLHILMWALYCTFVLISGYMIFQQYAQLQLNTSFAQRMHAIAPVLSEQQEEEMWAEWATMRTRTDYERINHKIETYAKARSVALPRLLFR